MSASLSAMSDIAIGEDPDSSKSSPPLTNNEKPDFSEFISSPAIDKEPDKSVLPVIDTPETEENVIEDVEQDILASVDYDGLEIDYEGLEEGEEEEGEGEEEPKPFSYFDVLDAEKYLPEPIELTHDHLKEIIYELGLIKLCWPEVDIDVRGSYPESYVTNNDKEKVLLLYAENFRKQYCNKYPNRRPLFLACENECGMQKMVCTTIRPTTLPYEELETWQRCSSFIADHLKYEPNEDDPTLLGMKLAGVQAILELPGF